MIHGHARAPNGRKTLSPTYRSWAAMIQRCTDRKSSGWKFYGGRGVKVCKRWLVFANFLADMGTRPSGHTLDRRRTGDGYRRKNCRWATPKTQARNRRSTRLTRKTATLIRHLRRQGKTYDELARTFGVKRGTINDVISRRTWT